VLLSALLVTVAHAFQQQTVNVGGHSVPVIVPDLGGAQEALPLILLLHGFCTPPRWQEFLTLVATRGIFGDAGPSVLTQVQSTLPAFARFSLTKRSTDGMRPSTTLGHRMQYQRLRWHVHAGWIGGASGRGRARV
jgi:hypothetical protein